MKKILALIGSLFCAVSVHSQTAAIPVYWCSLSGTQANVSGLKSTNYQLGIIPSCTVKIYLTGTTTLATTTPQSPFTANSTMPGSIQPVYAAIGQGYDVVLSGGIAPNTYPSPVTITDVFPGGGGGGGSGVISINSVAGAFNFGAGASCTGTSCTFPGTGSYTLPIATTVTLGGVKPDGTTTTVNPSTGVLTAISSGGGSSPFPSSFDLHLLGASLEQSVDVQGEVVPSATNGGSGYTPNATCTVSISGLTGTTQPTMGAYTDAAGKVQWTLTYFGQGLSGTGTATVSGCGAGSGASATLTVPASSCTIIGGTSLCYNNPWPKQLTTLSAMAGRVSSFINDAEGGSNVTDMWSAAIAKNYGTVVCPAPGNHWVILGGSGIFNSMSPYGSHPNLSAQAAVAQYLSLSHYLRAAGCKTIIMTPNVGSTYAGGTGSSMNGAFINKAQTAAQILRHNTIQGIDYDLLIDTTSAIQTNTDAGFFSFDNTHWTLGGDNMFAAYANNQLLAGGGPGSNLAPYYNWPITVDNNGSWTLNLASCSSVACFIVAAGDGIPMAIYSTQSNQLSGVFFQDGATKTNQGHIGYANGSYGLGTNLIDIGPETGATATGVVLHGQGYASYLQVTNQIVGLTSLFEVTSPFIQFPTQAAGSGHNCLQIDTSGYVTNTGSACGSGGGSGTVSGQASGVIPLATASTVIGAQSHITETGGQDVFSQPISVTGSTHGVTIPAGTQVSPVAGSAVYGSDSGSIGNAMVAEAGAAYSRICTAANASSVTGCQSGGGGTPAYPLTITGGVSGGVVYGSSSTQLTVSPAGTANVLMKWGGAATAPQNSSVTDNATTVTTTDAGGYVAPVFVANGTTAGFMDYPQGSDSGSVAPCNTATSICEEAPTSVTSYKVIKHGAAATGFLLRTNSSSVETESVVAATGSGSVVLATSPSLTTPNIGVATATGIIAGGTISIAVTGTGCSLSSSTGGATAGTYTVAGSGSSCTSTATLPTAPHGWNCWTAASGGNGPVGQTSGSTTTAVLEIAEVTSSQAYNFTCTGY